MDKKEIVRKLLEQNLNDKDKDELIDSLLNSKMTVDVDKKDREELTFGDKLADKVSMIAGSWFFIICFILFLILWIILNSYVLVNKIDPYPFILLNLLLSCIAAVQAPIIMMSQNREAKKDSLRNQNDYIVDLKSELILEDLYKKVELILENQIKLLDLLEK